MSRADRLIDACNFSRRYVLDANGVIGDIESFLDRDGDETDDVNAASIAIVCWRDDCSWSPVDMADYVRETLH